MSSRLARRAILNAWRFGYLPDKDDPAEIRASLVEQYVRPLFAELESELTSLRQKAADGEADTVRIEWLTEHPWIELDCYGRGVNGVAVLDERDLDGELGKILGGGLGFTLREAIDAARNAGEKNQ